MQNTQTLVGQGMKVILNGGSSQMESAMIPIQWFFDMKAAEMRPTHILIVDYRKNEFNSYNRGCYGRRFIVKVTDTIKFHEFLSAGEHTLCFVALSSQGERREEKETCMSILEWTRRSGYEWSIPFNDDQAIWNDDDGFTFVASLTVSITVPSELFAEVPQTGFKRAVWNFVNGGLRGLPEDQCHARRRFLWVFPLKILFYVPLRIVLGLVRTALAMFITGLVFFAGWKPAGPWRMLKNVWNFNYPMNEIREGKLLKHCGPANGHTYRAWKIEDPEHCWGQPKVFKKMPMAPWQLALLVLCGLEVHQHWSRIVALAANSWSAIVVWFQGFWMNVNLWESVWMTVVGLARGVIFGAVVYLLITKQHQIHKLAVQWKLAERLKLREASKHLEGSLKRLGVAFSLWKAERAKQKVAHQYEVAEQLKAGQLDSNQRYADWLKTDLVVTKAPAKVDLGRLPKTFDGKGAVGRKIVVSFFALKSRVCKPYSRG
jgi:hypothetical protein